MYHGHLSRDSLGKCRPSRLFDVGILTPKWVYKAPSSVGMMTLPFLGAHLPGYPLLMVQKSGEPLNNLVIHGINYQAQLVSLPDFSHGE